MNLGEIFGNPNFTSNQHTISDLGNTMDLPLADSLQVTASEQSLMTSKDFGVHNVIAGMNFGKLKSLGVSITSNDAGYTIRGIKNHKHAEKVISIIASSNPDIIITYTDDLEGKAAELVRKTKNPLWSVKAEDGVLHLSRNV